MYMKISKYKIKINKMDTFSKRIKSLRFLLKPIDEGYLFDNKYGINTYWFCQNTDIVLTNKQNIVKYIYKNIGTEKIIFPKRKVSKVYILPLGSTEYIKINDKLPIIKSS